jgi:hypothetical protein
LSSTESVDVFITVSVPSIVRLPATLKLFVITVSPVAVNVKSPEEAMTKFVPSP